ncbi:MAG: EpsD family peptidyl-prolyl cis-trans isomerase [Gallionella sp.]|jgi:peptidyl-prolyl cis-trans isomerase C
MRVNSLVISGIKNSIPSKKVLGGILILIVAANLVACGSKEKKAGQSLARVNGEDITFLQINDELNRAGIKPGQEEVARHQLLESLIDRQLIVAEAVNNKIDRTPEVMQAIERSKGQIIAQAYLRNITARITPPSKAEINEYYENHPEFFSKRKEFDLQQLIIAERNFMPELKTFIDSAKTLDEVAIWMDKHDVPYRRGRTTRTTADVPPDIAAKLLAMSKGQLFLVEEAGNKMLNMLADIKDSPVSAVNAGPQIEQFLTNKKNKDAVDVEIAHLRSLAKIEYFNASAPVATQPPVENPDQAKSGVAGQ